MTGLETGHGRQDMKILLADDEPNVQRLYRQMLEGNGYDVTAAVDGQEALDKIMSETFDLMILDLSMPRLDGFEVMAKMKEAGKTTPVIVMTIRSTMRCLAAKTDSETRLFSSIQECLPTLRRGLVRRTDEGPIWRHAIKPTWSKRPQRHAFYCSLCSQVVPRRITRS